MSKKLRACGHRIGSVAVLLLSGLLLATASSARAEQKYNGATDDVMLQGFHWTSSSSTNGSWYDVIKQNAAAIKDAGFTVVWFPPSAKSVDAQGYMPVEWNDLNSRYGTADQLKQAIDALKPARAIADIVVNHRNGEQTSGADFGNPAFADNAAAVSKGDECHCGKGEADTGDAFDGSRDLDHTNESVRQAVKGWLAALKQNPGFAGWRYDMVKGYAGRYVGEYNDASAPYLSVSERAKSLWREVNPFQVRSMERLAVLQAALEALDRADAARVAIASEGMTTTTGKSGVVHVHPLVKVEREARAQFAALWKQAGVSELEIGLPIDLQKSR